MFMQFLNVLILSFLDIALRFSRIITITSGKVLKGYMNDQLKKYKNPLNFKRYS